MIDDLPLISIVIPTYLRSDNVVKCVECIEKSFRNIPKEILIVDNDYFSGELKEILKSKLSTRFKYLAGSPICTTESSVNIGLENAIGEYIWVLGDDDYPQFCPDDFLNSISNWPDFVAIGTNFKSFERLSKKFDLLPLTIKKILITFHLNLELGFISTFAFRRKHIGNADLCKHYGQLAFLKFNLDMLNKAKLISIWRGDNISINNTPSMMGDEQYFAVFVKDLALVCHRYKVMLISVIAFNRASRVTFESYGNTIELLIIYNYRIKNFIKRIFN